MKQNVLEKVLALIALLRIKRQREAQQRFSQQSTMPGYFQQYQPQLDVLKQNLIDQTAYTPEAERQVRDMSFYAIPHGELRGQGAQAYMGNVGLNPDFANNPLNQIGYVRHEGLHNLDDSMWGSSDLQSVGDSTGFGRLLKRQNPLKYQQTVQGMKQSGLYNMQDPRTIDRETFAYQGQDPNVMLGARQLADRYSRIYQPMTKEINYSPIYPSEEFQSFLPKQSSNVSTTSKFSQVLNQRVRR